ncbi:MAG TPA: hypothetical protein VL742_15025 [Casimicrobiaceae bacterium]|nr:hypothetical protein [Casimicrobiaceae bacterium]
MALGRDACGFAIVAASWLWAGTALAGFAAPIVMPSPVPLSFSNQNVGTTSPANTEAYAVSGGAAGTAMVINSISASGDFAVVPGGTCQTGIGNAVPTGGSCTVFVTFTPTAGGPRSGTLTLNCTSVVFAGGGGFTCAVSGSSDLLVALLGNGIGITLGAPIPTLSSFALAVLAGAVILYALSSLKRRPRA